MRQSILNAVRTDLASVVKGSSFHYTIEEVHKSLKNIKDIKTFPSAYAFGLPSKGVKRDDHIEWTFPIGVVVYFEVKRDIDKEALLEQYAEKLIEDQLTLWQGDGGLAAVEGRIFLQPTPIE